MAMDPNFLAYIQGRQSPGQSQYGVGKKRYGLAGTGVPNSGPTRVQEAYDERDNLAKQRRNALLRRMQAGQRGNYMSSAWLKGEAARGMQ